MRVRVPPGVPYGSLAQLAEHLAVNQGVAGSSPAGIAIARETWSVEWRMPTLKSLPSLSEKEARIVPGPPVCRIGRNRTWNSVGNW